MFDIISVKQEILEHYFKLFSVKHNKKLVKQFIRDWIQFVEIYSKIPSFIRFDRQVPVLTNLNPNSKSLIILSFQNDDERFSNTSVFPICLFTAYFKNYHVSCKDSMNLLILYLKITNVKYIAFYKMPNYKKILSKIKEYNPAIKCYPPSSFHYFCKLNRIYRY